MENVAGQRFHEGSTNVFWNNFEGWNKYWYGDHVGGRRCVFSCI